MDIAGFVNQFYIKPIVEGTGYNVVNTLTYAAILIAAVYIILKVLRKLDVDLDRELWINLLPFVLLGGFTRALEDTGLFSSLGFFQYLFITPLIYLLIFFSAFIPLLVVNRLELKRRYIGYFGLSLLVLSSIFVILRATRVSSFFIALGIAFTGCFLTYSALLLIGQDRFRSVVNWSPILAHSLDASASYTAIVLVGGYTEQHVLPSAIFGVLPFFLFIPMKLALAAGTIYFIDSELEGKWSWMLKFMILVLGLGPGVRNILTILMGT